MNRHTTLTVERLAAGGFGLGRLEGRIVFLPGVLPGEEVAVEILRAQGDYFWAKPLEVLRPHPARESPPCPLFLICGGCQMMHLAYPQQPTMKTTAAIESISLGAERLDRIFPSPQALFYRDRVRLQLASVGGRLQPGFFAAASKRLIPLEFCHQLHPRFNAALPAIARWIEKLSKADHAPSQLEGLVGRPTEGLYLTLDFPRPPDRRIEELAVRGPSIAEPCRVFLSVRGRLMKPDTSNELAGLTWLKLTDHQVDLKAWPGVFVQVNPGLNRLLVDGVLAVADELKPRRVLDLYAGLGNFSLPLARLAGEVEAVEESPQAITALKKNLARNQIKNVKVTQADVVRAVKEMAVQGRKYDLIVMDPPRAGAKGLALTVGRLNAREIIYISCHPAAMSRDLAEFSSLGYRLTSLSAYDMFPQTAHVELLGRLAKGK